MTAMLLERTPELVDRLAEETSEPILAAIDDTAASRPAIWEAVRLAAELRAPVVFVYVRSRPAALFGEPVYQRRLTKEMARAERAIEWALAFADGVGVEAEGVVLEGSPRKRIAEFARARDARMIVVGSRRYKLSPSVSSAVVRSADRPVVVAGRPQPLALVR
jgi:nucleotide-binding universal stress UspA family protein